MEFRDQRWYSPVSACKRLKERVDALGTPVFDAELAQLRWLAERVVECEKLGGDGMDKFLKEFGLQMRATVRSIEQLEAAQAAAEPTEMSDADWKMAVIDGGQADVG